MLTNVKISKYKSLFHVDVDLEPLTVLIGPNGSGKSSFCEALENFKRSPATALNPNTKVILRLTNPAVKWRGVSETPSLYFKGKYSNVKIYNFIPTEITTTSKTDISSSGNGLANSLTKILFDDRDRFIELEDRFTTLVPNIKRIKLDQQNQTNILFLVDRYSDYPIPATNISDGTIRILAFLTALYDIRQPGIICFEEPENGIHPWLLNKIMELMQLVSTEGITGKPTQIIITTHSPVLLNYVEPKQIRAVELDEKGATQISSLPTETKRFQKAMEAYDNELGELWFTNIFGANPV